MAFRYVGACLVLLGVACHVAALDDIYAQPPSTRLGCECKGSCTTGTLFYCDVANYCTVKDKNCAKGTAPYSVSKGSYYDYCVYEPYMAYEKLTAAQKHALVLDRMKDGGSGKYPSQVGVLTGILGESVRESFDASADIFPHLQSVTRQKLIHGVGIAGGIRFDSKSNHEYTGLFKGAEHGIVRFSSAKAPDSDGVTPGMGVKFFRDGRPSANFVAMYSLDGQPCSDTDFFAHDWSNHINLTDNFGLKIIAAKFWQASYCPLQVGLSDLASDDKGDAGTFPYKLNFHALVNSDCSCKDYDTCLKNLEGKLKAGTKLFDVQAVAEPGAKPVSIGTIVVTSPFARSKFADEQLFFKHQHMEDDFNLRPKWLDTIDRKKECGMGCTGRAPPAIEKGCSSPFNGTSMEMLESDMMVV